MKIISFASVRVSTVGVILVQRDCITVSVTAKQFSSDLWNVVFMFVDLLIGPFRPDEGVIISSVTVSVRDAMMFQAVLAASLYKATTTWY